MTRVISGGLAEVKPVDQLESKISLESEFVIAADNEDEFISALNDLVNRFRI